MDRSQIENVFNINEIKRNCKKKSARLKNSKQLDGRNGTIIEKIAERWPQKTFSSLSLKDGIQLLKKKGHNEDFYRPK